jgi:23S rRNA (cytosine1962-C5)-methyltransferase
VLCAKLGCDVTHVDASKPSIAWAKENMAASGLPDNAIRWILDDALKFVKREARRGAKYNAVILDPPAFGRGAKNEVWKFAEDLPKLLDALSYIMETGKDFAFVVLNAYAVSSSSLLLKNLMDDFAVKLELDRDHKVDYGELVLHQVSGRVLSTGIFARLY